jgi:hypothetical protein
MARILQHGLDKLFKQQCLGWLAYTLSKAFLAGINRNTAVTIKLF